MKNLIIPLFTVVLLLLAGCSAAEVELTATSAPPTNTPSPTMTPTPEFAAEILEVGDPKRGREIFENGGSNELYRPASYCTACHSLESGEGGTEYDGPSLHGISKLAGDRVPELSAEDYIRQSIMQPKAFVAPGQTGRMSAVPARLLNEEEVDDLVAFLLTQ